MFAGASVFIYHIINRQKKISQIEKEAFSSYREIVDKANKQAEDILDMAKRYYDDAKFFEKKGDLVNAFGAVCYAHAFLDIGARLGFFDVGKDSKLFMVD